MIVFSFFKCSSSPSHPPIFLLFSDHPPTQPSCSFFSFFPLPLFVSSRLIYGDRRSQSDIKEGYFIHRKRRLNYLSNFSCSAYTYYTASSKFFISKYNHWVNPLWNMYIHCLFLMLYARNHEVYLLQTIYCIYACIAGKTFIEYRL